MSTPSPISAWAIDPGHSDVQFKVKHLVIATVTGSFRAFEGTVHPEGELFKHARVAFSLEVASLDTRLAMRDEHLKSADFFDAAHYPRISFQSTAFMQVSPETYKMMGNLTIRDVTRPVTLDVVYGGTAAFRGITRAGFEVSGKLSRQDFGLTLNIPNETSALVVLSDEIKLLMNVELIKQ